MATKPKRGRCERWGKPRANVRDWLKYNEQLVVRGEFLLDVEWVKNWDKELATMNHDKRGRPFQFPHSLIELQAVWNQWVGVRAVEGLTRKLVEFSRLPAFDDYSTINRRISKIDAAIELPKEGFCSVSTDGTGIKMHHAGEYRQQKYRTKKRRWIKITMSANPLTKDLLAVEVSLDGEGQSEPDIAEEHMKMLHKNGKEILKFWGDGAFDKIKFFNWLDQHNIESAIPPRDNASTNANGSMRRLREVFDYKTQSWNDWAMEKQYGKRWLGTEVMFSAVKGIFGEDTRAKNPISACQEAKRKFWAYHRMKRYAITKV